MIKRPAFDHFTSYGHFNSPRERLLFLLIDDLNHLLNDRITLKRLSSIEDSHFWRLIEVASADRNDRLTTTDMYGEVLRKASAILSDGWRYIET